MFYSARSARRLIFLTSEAWLVFFNITNFSDVEPCFERQLLNGRHLLLKEAKSQEEIFPLTFEDYKPMTELWDWTVIEDC